jgi:hypothetical protein
MTTVVFATDSPAGHAALTWAIDNRNPDEHLHLVLVAGDVPAKPGYLSPARVEELTAVLAPLGTAAHTVHDASSDPALLALDLAEKEKARFTHAPCPVVRVKREDDDATQVF